MWFLVNLTTHMHALIMMLCPSQFLCLVLNRDNLPPTSAATSALLQALCLVSICHALINLVQSSALIVWRCSQQTLGFL